MTVTLSGDGGRVIVDAATCTVDVSNAYGTESRLLITGDPAADFAKLENALSGCDEWTLTGGGLFIRDTDALTGDGDFGPLARLVDITGKNGGSTTAIGYGAGWSLSIQDNGALESLDGLAQLRGVLLGALAVSGNGKLVSLDGLSGLSGVGGGGTGPSSDDPFYSVYIYDNAALSSVAGLRGVLRGRTLPAKLTVQGGGALVSLAGLEGLVGATQVRIKYNNHDNDPDGMCLSEDDRAALLAINNIATQKALSDADFAEQCTACAAHATCGKNADTSGHCYSVAAGSLCPGTLTHGWALDEADDAFYAVDAGFSDNTRPVCLPLTDSAHAHFHSAFLLTAS